MKAGFLFLFFFFLCANAQFWRQRSRATVVPPFEAHFSVSLNVHPEYPAVAPVETAFSALIDVQARNRQGPVEYAVLLDKSGSMWSERLVLAKLAIEDIITHLTPTDRVHLITYNDVAEAIFTNETHESSAEMLAILDRIEEGGYGNLGDGIDLCLDILLAEEEVPEGTKPVNRAKTILLFTDGAPTAGETSHEVLFQGIQVLPTLSVSLVVFGLGDDQDVNFLTTLAQNAGGKFFPLEHASQIENFASFGLRGVDEIMARNIAITITPKQGLKVTQIPGPFNQDDKILIPFMRFGTRVTFLILLDFDFELETQEAAAKPKEEIRVGRTMMRSQESLVSCKLEFDAVKQITPQELKMVSFVKVENGMWVNVTTDEDTLARARSATNPKVRLRHAVDWAIMLQNELMNARAAEDMPGASNLRQNFAASFYDHFPIRPFPSELLGTPEEDAAAAAADACSSAASAEPECGAVLPE